MDAVRKAFEDRYLGAGRSGIFWSGDHYEAKPGYEETHAKQAVGLTSWLELYKSGWSDRSIEHDVIDDRVNLIGVRADGSSDLLGTIPTTPGIKRAEIARDYFGGCINPSDDDASDANSCLIALEEYHKWLLAKGWVAPEIKVTPKGGV